MKPIDVGKGGIMGKDKELELLESAYSEVFDLFEKDIRQIKGSNL